MFTSNVSVSFTFFSPDTRMAKMSLYYVLPLLCYVSTASHSLHFAFSGIHIFLRIELVQRAIDFRQLGIVLPQFRRALFDNFMQPPVLLRQPTRAPADQRPDDSSQNQQCRAYEQQGAQLCGEKASARFQLEYIRTNQP